MAPHVSIDAIRSSVWAILHHPMYHTYPHHDAGGQGTWTFVASGNKFWIVVYINGHDDCASRAALYNLNDAYHWTDEHEDFDWRLPYVDRCSRWCIFAEAGDIMSVFLSCPPFLPF